MKRSTPLKRTGSLNAMSPRRRKESAEYAKLRVAFLVANPICRIWMEQNGWSGPGIATGLYRHGRTLKLATRAELVAKGAWESCDIHHTFCGANRGKHYLNTNTWMAVSRKGHDIIHSDHTYARDRGWII
jgi:hypothetical protein